MILKKSLSFKLAIISISLILSCMGNLWAQSNANAADKPIKLRIARWQPSKLPPPTGLGSLPRRIYGVVR